MLRADPFDTLFFVFQHPLRIVFQATGLAGPQPVWAPIPQSTSSSVAMIWSRLSSCRA